MSKWGWKLNLQTGCSAKHAPLFLLIYRLTRYLDYKKYILRWCPVHAHFQNVLNLIPRCIKDKDNDQRANKAEIKTQICNLKYQHLNSFVYYIQNKAETTPSSAVVPTAVATNVAWNQPSINIAGVAFCSPRWFVHLSWRLFPLLMLRLSQWRFHHVQG